MQASGAVLKEEQISDKMTRQLVRDGRPEEALTLSHLLLNLKKVGHPQALVLTVCRLQLCGTSRDFL